MGTDGVGVAACRVARVAITAAALAWWCVASLSGAAFCGAPCHAHGAQLDGARHTDGMVGTANHSVSPAAHFTVAAGDWLVLAAVAPTMEPRQYGVVFCEAHEVVDPGCIDAVAGRVVAARDSGVLSSCAEYDAAWTHSGTLDTSTAAVSSRFVAMPSSVRGDGDTSVARPQWVQVEAGAQVCHAARLLCDRFEGSTRDAGTVCAQRVVAHLTRDALTHVTPSLPTPPHTTVAQWLRGGSDADTHGTAAGDDYDGDNRHAAATPYAGTEPSKPPVGGPDSADVLIVSVVHDDYAGKSIPRVLSFMTDKLLEGESVSTARDNACALHQGAPDTPCAPAPSVLSIAAGRHKLGKATVFVINHPELDVVRSYGGALRRWLLHSSGDDDADGHQGSVALFHVSDETPYEDVAARVSAYSQGPWTSVFRHYFHAPLFNATALRPVHLPLGPRDYVDHSDAALSAVAASERRAVCTFRGSMVRRGDRAVMAAALRSLAASHGIVCLGTELEVAGALTLRSEKPPAPHDSVSDDATASARMTVVPAADDDPAFQSWSSRRFRESLLSAAIALCPAGNNDETYRMYEALQAGAIPVLVGDSSADSYARNPEALGADCPVPILQTWHDLPAWLEQMRAAPHELDALQRRLQRWWWAYVAKTSGAVRMRLGLGGRRGARSQAEL